MKRYSDIYSYKRKLFRYDFENAIVERVMIAEEDEEILHAKKGDIIVLSNAGMQRKNWNNKSIRNELLTEWIEELDYESNLLAEGFLKYEIDLRKGD